MNTRYVIIGTSAAGSSVARKLRSLDAQAEILVLSAEQEMPYNKCHLADYLSGTKTYQQIFTLSQEYCDTHAISLLLGRRVIELDPQARTITYEYTGVDKAGLHETLSYDYLFIGTGVAPIVPALFGSHDGEALSSSGIFTFNTLADTLGIIAYLEKYNVQDVVVIGAGLSGLEVADSLVARGVRVQVVEQADQVLARQIDAEGADLLARHMDRAGVILHTKARVVGVQNQDGRVTGVTLEDLQNYANHINNHAGNQASDSVNLCESKTHIKTQMVIVAIGARPASDFAQKAGLLTHEGALVTNDALMTSDSHIFTGGDVALVYDQLSKKQTRSCTWPDAVMQGMVAAQAMFVAAQQEKTAREVGALQVDSAQNASISSTIHQELTEQEQWLATRQAHVLAPLAPQAHKVTGVVGGYAGVTVITSSAFFGIKYATCGPVVNPPASCEKILYRHQQESGEFFYNLFLLENDRLIGFLLMGDTKKLAFARRAMIFGALVDRAQLA